MTIPCCPRCGSPEVFSNAFQPFSEGRYVQAAQATRAIGFTGAEACVMAAWALNRAVNALRKKWVCGTCGWRFTPPEEPCHA